MSSTTLLSRLGYQPRLIAAVALCIERREQARRETEYLMATEPHGSGRGTVTRAASSVNGTETRASDRWQATPQGRRDGAYDRATVPAWYLALVDAAELSRDGRTAALAGFRRVTVTPEKQRKSSPRARVASAQATRTARLRQAAGTIRMADQD